MADQAKAQSRSALLRARGTEAQYANLPRHPLTSRFAAHPIRREHLGALLHRASRSLALSTTLATIERVYDHDPRGFFGLSRALDDADAVPAGFTVFLLLSRLGVQQLFDGSLEFVNPQPAALAKPDAAPAAIYIWLMFAPGLASGALFSMFEHLNAPPFDAADIYWRPLTEGGKRLGIPFGFRLVSSSTRADDLYVIARGDRPPVAAAEPPPAPEPITVAVARSFDDVVRAVAVRAAVYLAEQACPFDEEFDGNDFTATHILAHVASEPAACARIRWFGDFAKIERIAVRKAFRGTRVAFRLIAYALELCRRKGYRRVYGHVEEQLTPFWRRFGAKPMLGRAPLAFSDRLYVEMQIDLPDKGETIAFGSDPHIVNRPEGDWDRNGILDRSADRSTRLSAAERRA